MEKKENAVENKDQGAAPDQGVKKEETIAPESQEVDYMKLIDTITLQEQELAKERADKENYRKGMLKAKGKLPDDEPVPGETSKDDIEALVAKTVEEKLLSTKEAQLQAQKDAALKSMAKKLSELSVAVKNRTVPANAAAGSNQDKNEVKDSFFSDEQVTALKARGLDPEKVKANMLKQASQPVPVITK